jgi:hypothetical protein
MHLMTYFGQGRRLGNVSADHKQKCHSGEEHCRRKIDAVCQVIIFEDECCGAERERGREILSQLMCERGLTTGVVAAYM